MAAINASMAAVRLNKPTVKQAKATRAAICTVQRAAGDGNHQKKLCGKLCCCSEFTASAESQPSGPKNASRSIVQMRCVYSSIPPPRMRINPSVAGSVVRNQKSFQLSTASRMLSVRSCKSARTVSPR